MWNLRNQNQNDRDKERIMDNNENFNSENDREPNSGTPEPTHQEPSEPRDTEKRAVPEISFDLFRELEETFDKISVAEINLEGISDFKIIGMNELPMDRVMKLSHAKGERQIRVMREMITTCLINPEESEIIDNLNFDNFSEFVQQWVVKSKGVIVEDGDEE